MPHNDDDFTLDHSQRLTLQSLANRSCSQALGGVLIAFQDLEHLLTKIAGYLLDPNDFKVGIIVTSELSFRGVIGLVYSLAQHRELSPVIIERLREYLKDCSKVEERRNALIHSYWTPEPETLRVTRFKYTAKFPKGYRPQVENVSAGELHDLTMEIMDISGALVGVMDDHDIDWTKGTDFAYPEYASSSLLPRHLRSNGMTYDQ